MARCVSLVARKEKADPLGSSCSGPRRPGRNAWVPTCKRGPGAGAALLHLQVWGAGPQGDGEHAPSAQSQPSHSPIRRAPQSP